MSDDEIIRMALDTPGCERLKEWVAIGPVQRAAFEEAADRIAASVRNQTWTQKHWTEYEHAIVAAEREACAKVCEHNAAFGNVDERYASRECAAAIRERGQAS